MVQYRGRGEYSSCYSKCNSIVDEKRLPSGTIPEGSLLPQNFDIRFFVIHY